MAMQSGIDKLAAEAAFVAAILSAMSEPVEPCRA
jgi:hypothetical protein